VHLAQSCPRLQEITLYFCELTDTTVDAIAEHCPLLHSFTVDSNYITTAALLRLTSLRSLRKLGVEIPEDMTQADFDALMRNCPALQSLTLWGNNDFHDCCLHSVAAHCPALRDLTVMHYNNDSGEAGSSGLIAITQRCTNLREIEVEDWGGRPLSQTFAQMVLNCEQLTHFSVNTGADEAVVRALAQCPHLKVLNLYGVESDTTEALIVTLAKGCPELVELTLPEGAELTMHAMRALAVGCRYLRQLKGPSWRLAGCEEEIAALMPKVCYADR
jgi:hypothetical protein